MRAATMIFGLIMLSSVGAAANKPWSTRYRTVQRDGSTFIDRTILPTAAQPRIAVLHEAMTDAVYGRNGFADGNQTPALEIVAHNASLRQVREASVYDRTAKYVLQGSELPHLRADATLLMPQNGHIGGASEHWKNHNVFNLVLNGVALPRVKSTDFVTVHRQVLQFRPGLNKLQFWPEGSGKVGAYFGGREIEIEVQ